ncbi:hypothetical protein [Streptomyces sp. VNUA24]|uniref:hypothetical protein n=1 Tax=Streptomyces sp. VNUA24 TaxID=3031131 RepID=UPI0023B7AA59|nr:hypothetical protein [Streptomyces sp. VNUA24]WEH15005.1 hypothetical protein PYR72_15230 [Streptomyces sp. VNUA24]
MTPIFEEHVEKEPFTTHTHICQVVFSVRLPDVSSEELALCPRVVAMRPSLRWASMPYPSGRMSSVISVSPVEPPPWNR